MIFNDDLSDYLSLSPQIQLAPAVTQKIDHPWSQSEMSSSEADIPPQKTMAGPGVSFFMVSFWRNIFEQIWTHMIWYDMIWYDMIWHDMTWHDMIWYDMIWYDAFWDVFTWPFSVFPLFGPCPADCRSAAFANHLSSQTSSGVSQSNWDGDFSTYHA